MAIDFPSVSSVLDGMRHSFFGNIPNARLAAVVELTPQEAFWGALVPLQIPLRTTCAGCGGRGEVWDEWCVACAGTGEIAADYPLRLRVPPGARAGSRFRFSVTPPGMGPAMIEISISVR